MEQQGLRTVYRRFQEAIQEDRIRRISMTGTNIKALLTAGQTGGVWEKIQRWYRQAKDNSPHPTREGTEHTPTLREYLYRRPPPGGRDDTNTSAIISDT